MQAIRAISLLLVFVQWSVAVHPAEPAAGPAGCAPAADAQSAGEALDKRRRPGEEGSSTQQETCEPERMALPDTSTLTAPTYAGDRWRIVEGLGYRVNRLDPYHGSNPLKGDRPIIGRDTFLVLGATASSLFESRRIADAGADILAPDGVHGTTHADLFTNQSATLDAVLYRGDTVFRPPDWQLRATGVYSYSNARIGQALDGGSFALQALWFEKHLRDVSAHYDFDSVRVGVQNLTSDFRGFLLSDSPIALRLFGTRADNRIQYNLALLQRMAKNRVRLNDASAPLPHNPALLANLYWQDLPKPGLTSEFVMAYTRNRQAGMRELLVPGSAPTTAATGPHDYDVGYLGYGLNGHYRRLDTTLVGYYEYGRERQGTFISGDTQVRGWFAAAELAVDADWRRWRLSLLHASGDGNPYDNTARGFDTLTATPVFAGSDASDFVHERLALPGGAFDLKSRDALLPSLRPVIDGGQGMFTNPGLDLVGMGLDLDLTRGWRVSIDANALRLDQTAVLSALLQRQATSRDLGVEASVNTYIRPWSNQHVILRVAGAMLFPGNGYRQLYGAAHPYMGFVQLQLSY